MELKDIFNEDGLLINQWFDPYREDSPEKEFLFNENGMLKDEIKEEMYSMLKRGQHPLNDLARIITADDFAYNTKNNYPTIYLWR